MESKQDGVLPDLSFPKEITDNGYLGVDIWKTEKIGEGSYGEVTKTFFSDCAIL